MQAEMRLLLTGTPGCGKTVFAKKLARFLKARLVDVNALVEAHKIYEFNSRKEKVVELRKLQAIIEKILREEKNVVIESHLLCELRLPCERIIVLRCDPLVLEKRLERRRYPHWKIRENVMAELLDYCLIKAESNYDKEKVLQVDFTRPLPPKEVLVKEKGDKVGWMRGFAKVRRKIAGFLE